MLYLTNVGKHKNYRAIVEGAARTTGLPVKYIDGPIPVGGRTLRGPVKYRTPPSDCDCIALDGASRDLSAFWRAFEELEAQRDALDFPALIDECLSEAKP